jgi:hypothetical protein
MVSLFGFVIFDGLRNCRLHVNQAFASINEEVFGWSSSPFDGDGVNRYDGFEASWIESDWVFEITAVSQEPKVFAFFEASPLLVDP